MYIFIIRIIALFQSFLFIFKSQNNLLIENGVLRQQLISFKIQYPRPPITRFDRIFWVLLKKYWSNWLSVLIIVKPETVIRWHRKGFKLYWKYISRKSKTQSKSDRKREFVRLVIKMKNENPGWGAPRIHGELMKLGFHFSERTISRYLPKKSHVGPKKSNWLSFLHNHRQEIAAMDFFFVPTIFFRQLYCFFIIGHGMRTIIHVGATFHPNSEWVKERLTEIFTAGHSLKYMIYDRDSIFSAQVAQTLKNLDIETIRTSYRSPWQNGIAERFIGSVRRELLDHVIVFNENHLLRLMNEYIDYYHNDRTHYALNKDSPLSRPIQMKPDKNARLMSIPKLGGIHHRYFWQDVA